MTKTNRNWGLYFILFALFQLLLFCAGLYAVGIAFGGTFAAQGDEDLTNYALLAIGGILALVSSPLILILGAIGGVGMRSERSWARVVGIITASLTLLQFPLGTIFGILALRFLFSLQTREFYKDLKARGT